MSFSITQEDIQQLIREPSVDVRATITKKVCDGFNSRQSNDRERNVSVDIFRLLLKDTETRIRKTLAEELQHSFDVPRDVLMGLVDDKVEVAEIILQHSFALSEEDLIEIVQATTNVAKLNAIASRETITAPLSRSLVETGEHSVTKTLLSNNGAVIDDRTIDYLLEEYAQDQSILEMLVVRGGLPYHYAEKLFTLVSDQLKKELTKRYRLTRHVVDDITENAKEKAVLQFLSPWMSQQDIQNLVNHMVKNKRLTPSVVVRSLCIGDLRFFETAMAKMANVPVHNARILMMDPGALGFTSFYKATGMPEQFREAVHILLKLAHEETFYGKYQCSDYSERMIQRIVKEGHDKRIENMPYLMSIIGRSMQDVPTVH